ncbi:CRISPR-associated endonuclease Cas3'', partial [Thiolapillus sp.]
MEETERDEIMRGAPQACQAFGKLQRDEQGRIKYWLPLVDHMTDVAICFHELSQCHSIYRALGKAAERKLTEQDIARLAALVFLHDLGKANSGFQAKRWQQADRPHEWPTPAGHGIEATKIFEEESLIHLVDALPVSEICTWGEAVDSLLKASISHHGRPIIEQATNWNKAIWRPVKEANGIIGYDPLPVMEEMTQRVKILFPQAFSNSGGPLPSAPEFGHLFAGLVQLADWLGSDTRFFGYANEADDRVKTAWDNAENAILTVGLDANSWHHSLSVRQPTFTQTFEIEAPYPIQEAMDDT